ncbi:MAG: hypothetical protein H7Y17_09245, partial [Chlorobia bacterium]|nr:hypothetical protein [Fimbriimonadaceae bacterium]
KAGIIKPGIPVVVGEMPGEALSTILRIAKERGSEAWVFGREILLTVDAPGTPTLPSPSRHSRPAGGGTRSGAYVVTTPHGTHAGLVPGLTGVMQPHNMALAVAAMDAAGSTKTLGGLHRGARDAFVPGRMQRVHAEDREWLLDGAHNRESAKALAESLVASGDADRRIVLLTGMVQGHDPEPLYGELASSVAEVIFAPIDFHRAVQPGQLMELAGGLFAKALAAETLDGAIQAAISATSPDDLILVSGSFYLVGEVGRLFGLGDRE